MSTTIKRENDFMEKIKTLQKSLQEHLSSIVKKEEATCRPLSPLALSFTLKSPVSNQPDFDSGDPRGYTPFSPNGRATHSRKLLQVVKKTPIHKLKLNSVALANNALDSLKISHSDLKAKEENKSLLSVQSPVKLHKQSQFRLVDEDDLISQSEESDSALQQEVQVSDGKTT